MTTKQIDPNHIYTLTDILNLGVMPKAKSYATVHKRVMLDKVSKDILKVTIKGEGNNTKYLILGKNLIKYLAQYNYANTKHKRTNQGVRKG